MKDGTRILQIAQTHAVFFLSAKIYEIRLTRVLLKDSHITLYVF